MSPTYVLGLVFAIIILVMVFVKMRNSGLKERYGLWWYCIAFFTALLSIFPPILKWTALQLGVVVPLNLGFFLAGVVLLLLSLMVRLYMHSVVIPVALFVNLLLFAVS